MINGKRSIKYDVSDMEAMSVIASAASKHSVNEYYSDEQCERQQRISAD